MHQSQNFALPIGLELTMDRDPLPQKNPATIERPLQEEREGKRREKGGGSWEGRGEEGRKGPFPLFLFYESTTGMVLILGAIQALCTRALTIATPLPIA